MFRPNMAVIRLATRNNRQKISKTQHTGGLAEINPQSRVYFITSCRKSIKMETGYIISRPASQKLHFFGSRRTQYRTADETRHNTHNCNQSVHTEYSDGQKVLIPLLLWNLPKRQRKLSGQVCQDFKSEPKPPVPRIS
jgi:hypothetical protein